ncbi:protein ELYS [Scleropages formosus]|nr:protein ELYS [Scleropages formosus]XP_018588985.1 protein ELYS [Scleropages formosus]
MRDLAAQVTSGLLRFPEVTVNALGEDEITLDSVLHGKFTLGRSGLAWLACGPQLEVVHALTGERFSAYRFSGSGEHPPVVLVVRDFCWLKRTGLLVGLEDAEGSLLCLYDLSVSRVVKAVAIPGRITGIEPLVSYGGANAGTQHLHQNLRWFFGVAAVVTDVGHVLLVDLCLDDLSCSQSELEASDLEVVNRSPAEIPRLRESVTHQGRHLCLQLSSPTGTAVTALQYVTRTNQLAVGFSDGYLQLWNMKTLKKEYHSQLEGGRVPVYAFTFQEPENDPRNCCYLWAVQSTQDHEGDVVSLHLLQLAFGERKCLASGKILYEGLEYCEERYSQDLNGTAFPLRAQATSTRLLACQTIEKFRHHPDRDDSLNEVASPDTSVSIFSWQVKSYGQGKPSTYIGVFDINRWYHAQMPDSLRAGESLHSCPYLAVWSLDAVTEVASPYPLLDILVHERSFSRGLPYTCPPPEQFFNPTTYNFEATCLLIYGLVHVTCSGYQKETLSFLKRSAPCLSEVVPDSYSRCLMSGLLSSRLVDVQPSSLSLEEQLDAILSTAVETSSLGLITGFVKQWMTGDQPPTSVNLRYILDWAWNKVVITKEELDGICAPLFDSSSNFTDPQTLQLLQHSQRLLGNLSTIFHCMLNEAHELTQKGLIGLINKKMVSGLIAQYTQVVLWFCRTGLLPEGSDDGMLQISRPFYNYSVIKNYYTGRREELQRLSKGKWCSDCLMIDGLVAQFGERLEELWKRDEGGTGQYPPPTLHALLDIYLLENVEESAKHAVVIYLLLDVMYSYPNKSGTSVESFPTAFAIPIGLVKLVQGLWLLDHHNHENSLELLLHPSTSRSLWAWQHERVLQTLMCQGQHAVALRYLHTVKPQMTSVSQVKLCFTVLLYNRCMVEAWALLRQHSSELNSEEMLRFLYETCQELGLMKELLKLPLGFSEQETLEKFLQGTGGPQNKELLIVHYLQQANYVPALQLNQTLKMNLVNDRDPKMKDRSNTRNSILDQYGKVLPRVQRKLAAERAKPYHHPSTVLREVSRPQPLSTIAKRSATENVLTRAAFISNVLTKIGEVWVGKDATPESSPLKSPRVPELPLPNTRHSLVDLPEAFVGTPIAMTTRRKSRVLDLVVQPSTKKTPGGFEPQLTPPSTTASEGLSPPSTLRTGFLRSMTKAPELNLLQTPQVVKRARALAASTTMFSSFTPQSILRSSQRPTPVVSPSASPGRSTSPPLRSKESRITFIEETLTADSVKSPIRWGSTMTEKGEISLLSRSSAPSKSALEVRSDSQLEEEQHVTVFSPAQGPPGRDLDASEAGDPDSCTIVRDAVNMEGVPAAARVSMDYDTNQTSKSVDTTLEFHDAPLPEDLMEESSEELHGQWKVGKQEDLKTLEPAFVEVSVPFSANVSEEGPSTSDGATTRKLEAEQLPEKELAEEKVPEEEVAMEHSPKQEFAEEQKEHVAETMEHTGLDEFVERHLFGEELSPPLTRSSIRDTSETWTCFSKSESFNTDKVEEEIVTPVLTKQISVASASSRSTTTESHSVVSLNDSEELSSAVSEELGTAVQEDSGSEVEIIQEVAGDKSIQGEPILFQESPFGSEYLEPQAAVVLPAVTHEMCLEVNNGAENMEEISLIHDAKGDEEDGHTEPVFTELKPSAAVLIPLEQDKESEVLDGPDLALQEDIDTELPHLEPLGNFTLMLEADEGDFRPIQSRVCSDHLLMTEHLQAADSKENLEENELQQQLEPNTDILCLNVPDHMSHMNILLPTSMTDDSKTVSKTFVGHLTDEKTEGFATGNGENSISGQNVELVSEEQPSISAGIETKTSILTARVEGQSKIDTQNLDAEGTKEAPVSVTEQNSSEADPAQGVQVEKPNNKETELPPAEDVTKDTGKLGGTSVLGVKKLESQTTQLVLESTEDMEVEPSITTRRTTRQKRTTSFHSAVEVENDMQSEERKVQEQIPSHAPSTPNRTTRSIKRNQDSDVPFTLRRSTRKVTGSSQPQRKEEVTNSEATKTQTPQKATPRKSTRRTRNTTVAMDEDVGNQESSGMQSLAVPVTRAQSARKAKAADIEVHKFSLSTHLEKLSDRPAVVASSPRRTLQKSRGVTLALEVSHSDLQGEPVVVEQVAITPRKSTRKQLESKVEKSKGITPVAEELPLINSSRRPTRSQLWNHLGTLEKERPLLETALEVEPGAQLADAVMARLKDKHVSEGWQKEKASEDVVTEIVHSSRSLTKAVKDEVPPRLPTTLEAPEENEAMQEGASIMEAKLSETHKLEKSKLQRVGRSTRASKAPESDSSPVRDTFIFSPPRTRQRTKRKKVDSPGHSDGSVPQFVFSPPATRARRQTSTNVSHSSSSQDKDTVGGGSEVRKETETAKPRKRRNTKVKAAGVPSPVPINLISPMASPATAVLSRSQKKREETEGAPQRMQLRRKWLLDTIIPKPVTRRKIP